MCFIENMTKGTISVLTCPLIIKTQNSLSRNIDTITKLKKSINCFIENATIATLPQNAHSWASLCSSLSLGYKYLALTTRTVMEGFVAVKVTINAEWLLTVWAHIHLELKKMYNTVWYMQYYFCNMKPPRKNALAQLSPD